MNTVQRVAKNTVILMGSQVVMVFLSLIFVAYVARKLGVVGYGKYGFAMAFTNIFVIFSDLGLNDLLYRDVPRQKGMTSKYLGNILLAKLLLSPGAFAIIFIVINFWDSSPDTIQVVYLLGVYLILSMFIQTFRYTFHAHEMMEYGAVIAFVDRSAVIVLGILALHRSPNIVTLGKAYVAAGVLAVATSATLCGWKVAWPKWEVDRGFIKYQFKEAYPFGIMVLFLIAYSRLNVMLLSHFHGHAYTAWYYAALTIFTKIAIIPNAFTSSVYPQMSYLAENSKQQLQQVFDRSFQYLVLVAMPLSVALVVLSPSVVGLIFGKEFLGSVTALRILGWGIIFSFLNNLVWTFLFSVGKQKIVALNLGVAVSGLFAMGYLLLPRWGYLGAALVQVLAEVFLFGLLVYSVGRFTDYTIRLNNVVSKAALSAGVMGLVLLSLQEVHFVFLIFLGMGVYLGLVLLLRTLSKEDFHFLRLMVTRGESSSGRS